MGTEHLLFHITQKRGERGEELMVGKGSGGFWSQTVFNVAACVSAVQLSGFMDSLTVENVLLYSGPCPD